MEVNVGMLKFGMVVHSCLLESCTITYMGDVYLVHPVQICVPVNNWVIPNTRS